MTNTDIKTDEVDYLFDLFDEHELSMTFKNWNQSTGLALFEGPNKEEIIVDTLVCDRSMLDQVLGQIEVDFKSLPLLVKGDSKEIRLLTPKIALARLLPTVYSYTYNRYGYIPGTDTIRAKFSADIFRKMSTSPGAKHISTSFLGIVEDEEGPLLAERVVESCNLEVRVKRFHIGSPIHRYKFAEQHNTSQGKLPIKRWSKFEQPVVCFDWRHPLKDADGSRLADEPLPDDYAAIWSDDIQAAKTLARETFQWLEELFSKSQLQLIDICFFIDRSGKVIFGEISPDCMRIRGTASSDSKALDKDIWRSGGSPEEVLERYEQLYNMVFNPSTNVN